jgi:predicted small integral membrane protein
MQARMAKIAMVASLAAFALLVTYDNVADYSANFEFVRHVLSMDNSFPDNTLKYRAVTTPVLWHLAYWTIIAGEGLTGFAFAAVTVEMVYNFRSDASSLQRSKRFVYIGGTLGFPGLVLRLHGRWRRVVCGVAVERMERPTGGVSDLHGDPWRIGIRHASQ